VELIYLGLRSEICPSPTKSSARPRTSCTVSCFLSNPGAVRAEREYLTVRSDIHTSGTWLLDCLVAAPHHRPARRHRRPAARIRSSTSSATTVSTGRRSPATPRRRVGARHGDGPAGASSPAPALSGSAPRSSDADYVAAIAAARAVSGMDAAGRTPPVQARARPRRRRPSTPHPHPASEVIAAVKRRRARRTSSDDPGRGLPLHRHLSSRHDTPHARRRPAVLCRR